MYTLSKSNKHISFPYHKKSDFYIGFESIHQARHVQYNMNPIHYNFRLKLSKNGDQKQNIEDYIKIGKRVYLDTSALLSLDKKNQKQRTFQKQLVQELSYMIEMTPVDAHDFITQPFIDSKNIILPKKIIKEDINQITFQSIAIYEEPETLEEIKIHLEKFCL